MAVSSGRSGAGLTQETFSKASFTDRRSIYNYKVSREGPNYFLDFKKQDGPASTRLPLPWFIGSGSAARSFLISMDGFLYEAPVTYYTRTAAWDLSPGYERYSYPFLTRAIAP